MDPRCCLAAHFIVQSLNINKGQLEAGEMSDAVPDLDLGFSFLF